MPIQNIKVPREALFIPSHLAKTEVEYDGHNFFVLSNEGLKVEVNQAFLSPELRGISPDQLRRVVNTAYLSLHKTGDDYALRLNGRLRGGGPISGWIAYGATKAVCYGAAIAAATAGIITTGGAAAGAAGSAVAAGAIGAGTASASAATAGVAAAIGTSATATALASQATIATVAATGSVASAVAAVESAAVGAGWFFTCIPWLP